MLAEKTSSSASSTSGWWPGIPAHVKAWVEALVSLWQGMPNMTLWTSYQGNNDFSVTLDLAVRRNKDVMLIHTMSIDEDGTTVEVTFQYNKMGGTASGNLIVILLDINGQPLEKQQSCTKQDGLLELSNERSATQSFTFM